MANQYRININTVLQSTRPVTVEHTAWLVVRSEQVWLADYRPEGLQLWWITSPVCLADYNLKLS